MKKILLLKKSSVMKKILLLFVLAITIAKAFSATHYWIGGASGNWSDASKWSSTRGGSPGTSVPTNDDNVVFDNSAGNANPTVTLTADIGNGITATLPIPNQLSSISFINSNVTFAGNFSLYTNAMILDGSQVTFVYSVFLNKSLTFQNSGATTTNPLFILKASTGGKGLTLGNGTDDFTLTGNSATNYFDGNANAYFIFNIPNTNATNIKAYFNPAYTATYTSASGFGAISVVKGLITLANDVTTSRLLLSSGNNQELILGENTSLTIVGNGTCQFSALTSGGVVDASAAGSKFIDKSSSATINESLRGRLFKPNTVVNYFEMNNGFHAFTPTQPLTIKDLVLTLGTINNSETNNITIANGGSITRTAGKLLIPPVYGTSGNDKANLIIAANCTAANEILGTVGKIGTLTINTGITYTMFNPISVANIYISSFNGGIGYSSAQTPTISSPATGNPPSLATVLSYGFLSSFTLTNGTGTYSEAPTITFSAPTVNAWAAATAYTVNTVVSNGATTSYYVCTTAGTSGTTATEPSASLNATNPSKDAIIDGTAKWSYAGNSLVTATATASIFPSRVTISALNNNGTLTDPRNIVTVDLTSNTLLQNSKLKFAVANKSVTITGLEMSDVVSVISMNGQLAKTFSSNESSHTIDLLQGLYLVKVSNAAGNYSVSKIMIK
jgi:hypothetical protein